MKNSAIGREVMALLAVGLCWTWPRCSDAASYSIADLTAIHKGYLTQTASQAQAASLTGNSMDCYFMSIYLMGMLSAVDVTQDDAELQVALQYLDNMKAHTVPNTYNDSRGVSHTRQVWGPLSGGKPNELYNIQGAEPFARAAVIINKYASFKTKYAAKATAYTAFVDDIIFQRWYVDVYDKNPEWLVGDPPSWGDNSSWNDKSWLLGDVAASMYIVTKQPSYLTLMNQISAGFRTFLQPLSSGWIWNHGTIPIGSDTNGESGSVGNQDGGPDTDHANRVPVMMINQYEAGIGGWTLADMQRLAATLGSTMWNGSTTDPQISNYVDGSNKPYRTHLSGANGFIFAGWALTAKYAPAAQSAALAIYNAIQNGPRNSTVGENSDSYYKTVGISGHLLWALASSSPLPAPPPSSGNRCDLNGDGQVDTNDLQLTINQALAKVPCTNGDLVADGVCAIGDVQRVANAVRGGP